VSARLLSLLGLALCASLLDAQTPAPEQARPATAPASASQPAASPVSVEEAYRKEFAFLSAQKRELESQLGRMREMAAQQQAALNREIGALEARVLSLDGEAQRLDEQLRLADESALVNADNRNTLQATFAQAGATLEGLGHALAKDSAFAQLGDADKLARLYAAASSQLSALSSVRKEQGSFFLADGTLVEGEIVRIGHIAAYGISEQGAGTLAPAGAGKLKLWREPAADVARAVAAGQMPAVLPIFVYENTNQAVSDPEKKTVAGEVRKGGPIGYTIVVLGLIALILAGLRAFFLWQAGAKVQPIIDAASPLVRQYKIPEAIEAVKRYKGSAARVLTAALRNIDRDREHLEDIIAEAILHESGRLNRFGALILMIAAVAPLLGLLGTVTGMIQTFDVITEFGTSDPKLLAGGIAVALVTTELGLIVAIPCLLLGNLLSGWADGIKDDMEQGALKVINLHQERRERPQAAVAKA
jgi:biopolymer transport protein ExbB